MQGGNRLPKEKIKAAPAKNGMHLGADDKPVELHHRNQTEDGPIDEMTMTEYRGGANYKKNHTNTGQTKSSINRKKFSKLRKVHWKKEWDGSRFDKAKE